MTSQLRLPSTLVASYERARIQQGLPGRMEVGQIQGTDRPRQGRLSVLHHQRPRASCGVYFLHEGYACADLRWSPEEYRSVCAELVAAELIDHDAEQSVVLIERWFDG